MKPFSEEDKIYLLKKGISPEKAAKQIQTFQDGIPFVALSKAAVVGDGIIRLSVEQQQHLRKHYKDQRNNLSILKFIPASGAASRMFKDLFGFLKGYNPQVTPLKEFLNRPDKKAIKTFYEGLERFPFFDEISGSMSAKADTQGEMLYAFISAMLTEKGKNYGFYPKGLLPFHRYGNRTATPFVEHLKEGAAYGRAGATSHLHFTISPQHRDLFQKEEEYVTPGIAAATGCKFEIDYSYQKESTDTLAVTPENEPFRDRNGQLLFRPGGHGALLENLNDQEADLIFVKNIDNVVPDRDLEEITAWKEVLAGYLLKLQTKAFSFHRMLIDGTVDHDLLKRAHAFLETGLNVRFSDAYPGYSLEEQFAVLIDKLSRPIRVCGMVRNEGDPGGGPFWITDAMGNESLQIVESAQVDLQDQAQLQIFEKATHFNPVDLVCGVRDAFGKKLDLLQYVNSKQGFIASKTFEGRTLKALELPGLWNGGMAYWNTVFVEVPGSTFNPVKTVNDLLKAAHQS
ncbi:MAG: DUF4301 family protein [Robiginitalea sp.]|uniref:DUF4301 family protein n=1 Tax=Robiginitalea sp. TaxID=1902411 RepID=UPI003C759239